MLPPVRERAEERPARIMLDAVYTWGGRPVPGGSLYGTVLNEVPMSEFVELGVHLCSCEKGDR
jgi:hypothetical protein